MHGGFFNRTNFILDCSDFEMYAKFKYLFIPISELYEAYKHF